MRHFFKTCRLTCCQATGSAQVPWLPCHCCNLSAEQGLTEPNMAEPLQWANFFHMALKALTKLPLWNLCWCGVWL